MPIYIRRNLTPRFRLILRRKLLPQIFNYCAIIAAIVAAGLFHLFIYPVKSYLCIGTFREQIEMKLGIRVCKDRFVCLSKKIQERSGGNEEELTDNCTIDRALWIRLGSFIILANETLHESSSFRRRETKNRGDNVKLHLSGGRQ